MFLYVYTFSAYNKFLKLKKVEVKETEKMFISKDEYIYNYTGRIKKDSLNKIINK